MKFKVDLPNVQEVSDELLREILGAGSRTVRDATRRMEKDFEALTRAGVPGKAWRAWKSESYPRGAGPAREPMGMVFVNGGRRSRGMMNYWSLPGTNRAAGGGWLAIPLPAAGVTGRSRHLTPAEWERRTGLTLRIAYPDGMGRGRSALLVTDGVVAKNKSGVLKKRTKRRAAQGREKVMRAIFLLIPEQPYGNTVTLGPAIDRSHQYLVDSYARRIQRIAQGQAGG